ncbi:hypothetical protein OH76DRAFT_407977 [Lentinus brumalis]|uniref:Uncharacterized protein n=1 Tax=Lentinus brumalis TaxID=2498619 RepID=A0A371DVW4_9APHY|nr:hypothetical protein OH76DRAFT_407977 [Polyporus brumalis]
MATTTPGPQDLETPQRLVPARSCFYYILCRPPREFELRGSSSPEDIFFLFLPVCVGSTVSYLPIPTTVRLYSHDLIDLSPCSTHSIIAAHTTRHSRKFPRSPPVYGGHRTL